MNDYQNYQLTCAAAALSAAGALLGAHTLYTRPAPRTNEEIANRKNLKYETIGSALVAVASVIFASQIKPIDCSFIAINEIKEDANCPINKLNALLQCSGRGTTTAKAFNIFKETQGLTCDNYLPWQDRFWGHTGSKHIVNVSFEDLKNSAMWTIDTHERAAIALKSIWSDSEAPNALGVLTVYQAYTTDGESLTTGGSNCYSCALPYMYAPRNRGFDSFRTLLTTGKLDLTRVGSNEPAVVKLV